MPDTYTPESTLTPAPTAAALRSRQVTLGRLVHGNSSRLSGLFLWGAIVLLFALWTPGTFLTGHTVKSIAGGQSITSIVAIAVLFPLAAGQLDLSVAQNLGFSAVFVGWLMFEKGVAPVPAILVTLAIGTAVGLVNGLLVARIGVPSIITTLGMSSLLLAGAEWLTKGGYFGPFPSSFTHLTSGAPVGLPSVAFYLLGLAVIAWIFLEHTAPGRRVFAVGANSEAARLAGVSTKRLVVVSFTLSGAGSAIAGILLASSVNSTNQTLGPSYLLPAYAGAFLGATQIHRGRFNVWGTLLAIFLLGTGVQGLQLVGAQLWVTDVFNGAALIGAVSVAVTVERRRRRASLQHPDPS
ncbi:MAG: rbsC [Pseudonocardiales bacterium]|nr:rbsC [Pseudonocardiales bacterium]